MRIVEPKLGDFALVRTGGLSSRLIRVGTDSFYNHALLYVGDGKAIEAEPAGASFCDVSKYSNPSYRTVWSTDVIVPTDAQREAIAAAGKAQLGTPYSWADIGALTAKTFGINWPYFNHIVENQKRLICSQLVDKAYMLGGYSLFNDGRLTGQVTPGALWTLLLDAGY